DPIRGVNGLDDVEGRIALVALGGGERAVEQVEHPVEADRGAGQRREIEVPHGPHPLASNVDTRDAGHQLRRPSALGRRRQRRISYRATLFKRLGGTSSVKELDAVILAA